LTYLLRVECSD